MSKQEFLDTLRRALARELSESEVADNINYYWNYIEQQGFSQIPHNRRQRPLARNQHISVRR